METVCLYILFSSIQLNLEDTIKNKQRIIIPFIEQHIRTQDKPESEKEIILASWRITTKKRYNTTYRKWQEFCTERNINSIQPSVNGVVSFFSLLYHQGQGYRSICNTRSALNNIIYLLESSDIYHNTLWLKDSLKPFQSKASTTQICKNMRC